MERPRIGVENQRQEVAVALPQRQIEDALDVDPLERSFQVARECLAAEGGDQEDEAEPVLAVLAESGPADRAAQGQINAVDAGFLVDLATHAGDDVLTRIDLAAEAVVLAE